MVVHDASGSTCLDVSDADSSISGPSCPGGGPQTPSIAPATIDAPIPATGRKIAAADTDGSDAISVTEGVALPAPLTFPVAASNPQHVTVVF